jgi:hypothetical protein
LILITTAHSWRKQQLLRRGGQRPALRQQRVQQLHRAHHLVL